MEHSIAYRTILLRRRDITGKCDICSNLLYVACHLPGDGRRDVTIMDKRILLKVLECEIERTTGCTDPGAVCLAVRRATKELGIQPEKIVVTVSPNIYKNGINV